MRNGSSRFHRRGRAVAAGLALVALAAATTGVGSADAAPPPASGGGPAPSAEAKLSGLLRAVAHQPAGRSTSALNRSLDLPARGPGTLLDDGSGRLVVDVATIGPGALAPAVLSALDATITATTPTRDRSDVAIAADRLTELAARPEVRAVNAELVPDTQGSGRGVRTAQDPLTEATCPTGTTSEGDAQLKAALARSANSVDGTGVKVGVISDSFNVKGGAATDVAAGDLPGTGNPCGHTTPVTIVSDMASGSTGTDEGRAMAQIVHDLAPGAQLLYATANGGQVFFANQIRALRDAGATIIVDDISYGDEPRYQDGVVAQAINEVEASGVAYFASAENSHWTVSGKPTNGYEATGGFRSMACDRSFGTGATCHDFDPGPGTSPSDLVTLPNGGRLRAYLKWSEPMWGVGTDLDLYVINTSSGNVLTYTEDNRVTGEPFAGVDFTNQNGSTQTYKVYVVRKAGTGTPRFHLTFYRARFAALPQFSTTTGGDVIGTTFTGHHAASSLFSVAAVSARAGDDPTILEPFSTWGPAEACWSPELGTRPAAALAGGCRTKTVDAAASDGVTTAATGTGTSFNPFYGTSAAAPHAAAIAALLAQKRPCLSPAQLKSAVAASGRPLANTPTDAQGSGLIDATAAFAALPASCGTKPTAPGGPMVTAAGWQAVDLAWTPPTSAGSTAVQQYVVKALAPGASTPSVTVATQRNATSARIQGLTQGTAYRFTVSAQNGSGTGPASAASPVAIPPFTSVDGFTKQQHQDFAGRAPTASELTAWRSPLTTGSKTPAAAVVEASALTAFGPKVDGTTRQYYAYFQREPDTAGLAYWLGQLRAGKGLSAISNSFASSQEFKSKYGSLSNGAFVDLVYQNVLGRDGEPDGVAYWTSQLDQRKKTRGEVMTGFSESTEHKNRRAGEVNTTNIFFGMLRRVPTASELSTWKAGTATDKAPLVRAILTSSPYDDRTSG